MSESESQRLRRENVQQYKSIAALEADLEVMSRHRNDFHDRAKQAEAALAERDRMLDLAVVDRCPHNTQNVNGIESCEECSAYLADLRARAEEGSGDAE